MEKTIFTGNKKEQEAWNEVMWHNGMAQESLDQRTPKWDTIDELFRSHIDESNWPYSAEVFDPRTFTFIFEKSSRQFARKPQGRLLPREGGDALGARISNELLNFQWDDVERVDGMPMLAKWAQMDMNARKYGGSFALAPWHYETRVQKEGEDKGKRSVYYDGPNFKPWNNRDVLCDSSYQSIKNWIQLRDYVTIQELKAVNDAAKGKPIYKNIDILVQKIKDGHKTGKGGDTRASNYQSVNLSVRDLTDQRGRDPVFQTVEIVTEYRRDRWITFAPKHGVVLRDIPNPYDHGQIPVVMLKYYPIDDDIYGLSEVEPVEKLQKAINAFLCQELDRANMALYPISKVKATGVQMHTLEWGPGKKWIMDDPTNVVPHEVPSRMDDFVALYRLLLGQMQEALGETSAAVSAAIPGQTERTATEIRDSAIQRKARDNFNQLFLEEAMKKQMMFWHTMNRQFLFTDNEKHKIIRIVGKEAIRYFQGRGLDGQVVPDEALELLASQEAEGLEVMPEEFMTDLFPVEVNGEQLPKFTLEEGGEAGSLILEPDDLSGNYDYIADTASMVLPDDAQILSAKKQMVELALNPATGQQLMQEGYKLKVKEVIEDFFEQLGLKDAEKYFEKAQQLGGMPDAGINPAGAGSLIPGQAGQGVEVPQGMAGGAQTTPGNENIQRMG